MFRAYSTYSSTIDTGIFYTAKPNWFIAKVNKKDNTNYLSIICNEGSNRSFTIKLKNKASGVITTLESIGYSSSYDYKSYYIGLSTTDYLGAYEVMITASDRTVYTCPIDPEVEFV